MSHRAVVAIQTGTDSYDVHYSHNGAYQLQLTDILRDHVAGKTGGLDGDIGQGTQVPQVAKWQSMEQVEQDDSIQRETGDHAIDPDPLASGVPLEQIGFPVEFDDMEALYLVREGGVETYYPAWMEPNVVRPWREHLEVEVYPAGKLAGHPKEWYEQLESQEPTCIIGEEALSGGYLDETPTHRIVRDDHEAVYALQRKLAAQEGANTPAPDDAEEYDMRGMLQTESDVLLVKGPSDEPVTPDPHGRGVFIEMTDVDEWISLTDDIARHRFPLGARLNVASAPSDDDLSDSMRELAVEVFKEYRGRIAEFSPPPYGPIVGKVEEALG